MHPILSVHAIADPTIEAVFSLSALEANLVAYVKDPDQAEKPFDISTIPKISREQAAKETARMGLL